MAADTATLVPRWRRWLHRIGYLTTVLIALELLFAGFLQSRELLRRREISVALVEDSRTHETPLQLSSHHNGSDGAIWLLNRLPPLRSLNSNGFRFAVMPTFGEYNYAIALTLSPNGQTAEGSLNAFDVETSRLVSHRRIAMPSGDYRALVSSLDTMTDAWPGDDTECLDGSVMAFGRVRAHRVTSGIGNCSAHYERIKLLTLNYMRKFAPGPDLPPENDWHRVTK